MSMIRMGQALWVGVWLMTGGLSPVATGAEPTRMELTGTMHLIQIQGGCWVLESDQGKRYELVGDQASLLPLRREGLRVSVEVEADPNLVGRCMVGQMVRLIRVIPTETHGSLGREFFGRVGQTVSRWLEKGRATLLGFPGA